MNNTYIFSFVWRLLSAHLTHVEFCLNVSSLIISIRQITFDTYWQHVLKYLAILVSSRTSKQQQSINPTNVVAIDVCMCCAGGLGAPDDDNDDNRDIDGGLMVNGWRCVCDCFDWLFWALDLSLSFIVMSDLPVTASTLSNIWIYIVYTYGYECDAECMPLAEWFFCVWSGAIVC